VLRRDGRFEIDDLPPGGRYLVRAHDPRSYDLPEGESTFHGMILARSLPAGPGAVIDLGTFDVSTGERVEVSVSEPEQDSADGEPADVPITGRVIDLEGRPVASATVGVERMYRPREGDLAPWLEAVSKGEPPHVAYRFIESAEVPEGVQAEAMTDADGQFRLDGLGADRVVVLGIGGPGIAFSTLYIVTRPIEPIDAGGYPNSYGPGTQTIYGSLFRYAARPSRPIEGVVRDAETGEPLSGVKVVSDRFAGSDFVRTQDLETTTDDRGRFRLLGMPKGQGNQIMLLPNDDQPYFMREIKVADQPGLGPVEVEVDLHQGLWITGTVTDKATGEPLEEAILYYLPLLTNKHAQALPEFDEDGNTDGYQSRYRTGADGSFRLPGLPGRAIVGANADSSSGKTYRGGLGSESIEGLDKSGHFETFRNPINPGVKWPHAMMEIDPPDGATTVRVDLALDPGATVRFRVVDTEGKPVTETTVLGKTESGGWFAETPEAEFDAINFAPDEQRTVAIRHLERSLGKVVRVGPGDDATGPIVVELEPLAEIVGRVVDPDGDPVVAAQIRPDFQPSGDFSPKLPEVVTDQNGRFRIPDVPVGCDYGLAVEHGTMLSDRRFEYGSATVRPGETTDIVEIRFERD
jgi:hypothetical protein